MYDEDIDLDYNDLGDDMDIGVDEPTKGAPNVPREDLRLRSAVQVEPFIDASKREVARSRNRIEVARQVKGWITVAPMWEESGYEAVADASRTQSSLFNTFFVTMKDEAVAWSRATEQIKDYNGAARIATRALRALGVKNPPGAASDGVAAALSSDYTLAAMAMRALTDSAVRALADRSCPRPCNPEELQPWERDANVLLGPEVCGWRVVQGYEWTGLVHTSSGAAELHFAYGDSLRCLLDVATQRLQILRAADIALRRGVPGYVLPESLVKIFLAGDHVVDKCGNGGYDSIKLLESLCYGRLIEIVDDRKLVENGYYTRMKAEAQAKSQGHAKALVDLIDSMPGVDEVAQVFGMFRVWGHPMVDVQRGIQKMRETGCRFNPVDPASAAKMQATWRRMLYQSYFAKHHNYPTTNCSALADGNPIRTAIEKGAVVDTSHTEYDILDWNKLVLSKAFDITDKITDLSLLADKAASLEKSEIIAGLRKNGKIPSSPDRRLLCKYIFSQYQNIHDLLNEVATGGFTEEDLVIGVTPKERELKIAARCFSLMTMKCRQYIAATEKIISDFFLPYFPSVTMTMSGSELLRKLFTATESASVTTERVRYFLNLDFSSWNLFQRDSFVLSVFRDMDTLIGMNGLIARTHQMFRKSTFYRCDGYEAPTAEEMEAGNGKYAWTHHEGGVEGLRQKGWTICTAVALHMLAEESGIDVNLLAQGDNQVLIIDIKRPYRTETQEETDSSNETIRVQVEAFVKRVGDYFRGVSLILKEEESWLSNNVFAYGKLLIVNGRMLPTVNKKASRISGLNNENYASYMGQVEGIYSAGTTAAETDNTPVVAMELVYSEHMYAYRQALKWTPAYPPGLADCATNQDERGDGYVADFGVRGRSHLWPIDPDIRRTLQMEPALYVECVQLAGTGVGLYGTLPATSFLSRSFPDPITESYGYALKYVQNNEGLHPYVIKAAHVFYTLHPKLVVDPKLLAEDPVALNIVSPTQPENILKNTSREYLRKVTIPNSLINALVRLDQEEYDDVVKLIFKIRPVNPRLMSFITDCTSAGKARHLIAQIVANKSLLKISQADSRTSLSSSASIVRVEDRIARTELARHNYVLAKMSFTSAIALSDDVFATVQQWREVSWKEPSLRGVTIVHPLTSTALFPVLETGCDGCKQEFDDLPAKEAGYVSALINRYVASSPGKAFTLPGGFSPYLGNETSAPTTTGTDYAFDVMDDPIRMCLLLLSIVGWLVAETSLLHRCLMRICGSLTDVPERKMRTWSITSKSSALHRLRDSRVAHGGRIAFGCNAAAHISLSPDTAGIFSKGSDNRAIHFQQWMLFAQSTICLSQFWAHSWTQPVPCFHSHVTRPNQHPPVDDCEYTLPEEEEASVALQPFTAHVDIAGLYTSEAKARPHLRIHARRPPIEIQIDRDDVLDCRAIQQNLFSMQMCRSMIKHLNRPKEHVSRKEAKRLDHVWYHRMDPSEMIRSLGLCLVGLSCVKRFDNIARGVKVEGTYTPAEFRAMAIRLLDRMELGALWAAAEMMCHPESRRALHSYEWCTPLKSLTPAMVEAASAMRTTLRTWINTEMANVLPSHYKRLFPWELSDEPVNRLEVLVMVMAGLYMASCAGVNVLRQDIVDAVDMTKGLFGAETEPDRARAIEQSGARPLVKGIVIRLSQRFVIRETDVTLEKELRFLPCTDFSKRLEPGLLDSLTRQFDFLPTDMAYEMVKVDTAVQSTVHLNVATLKGLKEIKFGTVRGQRHYLRNCVEGSTTAYKVFSILRSSGWKPDGDLGGLISIADGIGGLASCLERCFRFQYLFFNSLVITDGMPECAHTAISAPMLEASGVPEEKIRGLEAMRSGYSDVTTPGFRSWLDRAVGDSTAQLITCDAEMDYGGFDKVEGILSTMIWIKRKLHPTGRALFKFYTTRRDHMLYVYGRLTEAYRHVEIHKSRFTSAGSMEVYIMLYGARAERAQFVRSDGENVVVTVPSKYESWCTSATFEYSELRDVTHQDVRAARLYDILISTSTSKNAGYNKWADMQLILGLDGASLLDEDVILSALVKGIQRVYATKRDRYHTRIEHHKRILSHVSIRPLACMYIYLMTGRIAGGIERIEALNSANWVWTAIVIFGDRDNADGSEWTFLCVPGRMIRVALREAHRRDWETWRAENVRPAYSLFGLPDKMMSHKDAGIWYQRMRFAEDLRITSTRSIAPNSVFITNGSAFTETDVRVRGLEGQALESALHGCPLWKDNEENRMTRRVQRVFYR